MSSQHPPNPQTHPDCALKAMAQSISSHHALPRGRQLATGAMELPRGGSDSSMGSRTPAERKDTFGMPASLSPESEEGDSRTRAPLSSEPEDESGKHFPRASTRLQNAVDILPVPSTGR